MKTKKIVSIAASTAFIMFAMSVMAQGGSGPPGPPLGSSGPIDGGVVSLLIGVVAYGYRQLKLQTKTEEMK